MPFLQVAYETGLRRGSLLAIRHEDIEADWLRIDGSSTKTLKRQSFRLSEQTISTLRDIWDPPRERMFDYDNEGTSYKHFHLLIVAANIRRCRRKGLNMFHMIRRTTATLIAARAG